MIGTVFAIIAHSVAPRLERPVTIIEPYQLHRRQPETRAQAVAMDVGSKESIESALEEILKRKARIDVLAA